MLFSIHLPDVFHKAALLNKFKLMISLKTAFAEKWELLSVALFLISKS